MTSMPLLPDGILPGGITDFKTRNSISFAIDILQKKPAAAAAGA